MYSKIVLCKLSDYKSLQCFYQFIILHSRSYRHTQAVATKRYRITVTDNDPLSYQIIIDFHRIRHPYQEEIGIRRGILPLSTAVRKNVSPNPRVPLSASSPNALSHNTYATSLLPVSESVGSHYKGTLSCSGYR